MVAYTEYYRTTRIFQSLASADKTLQTFTYLHKAIRNPPRISTKANWFCNKARRKLRNTKSYEYASKSICTTPILAPEAVHSKHLQKTFRPSLNRVWKFHEIAWNRATRELQAWEFAISEESGDHTSICVASDVFSEMQQTYWKLSVGDQRFKLKKSKFKAETTSE